MRPLRSTMRHRALKIAVAVSWASSIQFSGCLNSPFRPDFVADAKQAAAKQSVNSISDSVRDSDAEAEFENSRIQLAGGDLPGGEGRIVQVSGEKQSESGFSIWKFWKRDKVTPTGAKQEPPKDGASPVAKKNSTPAKPTSTPATAKTPDKAVASATEKDAARRALDPENWFAASGAKPKSSVTPKPNATSTTETSKVAASAAAPDFTSATVSATVSDSTPATVPVTVSAMAPVTASSFSSRPFPSATDGLSTTQSIADSKSITKTDAVALNDAVAPATNSSNSLPSWLSAEPSRAEPSRAETTTAETGRAETSTAQTETRTGTQLTGLSTASGTTAAPLMAASHRDASGLAESATQRQQRLRVTALMSDAHSCMIRGELHAAYRSALLAERIASEHQLSFTADEDNPSQFSRQIASRIWGSDASKDPVTAPTTSPATSLAIAPATEPATEQTTGTSENGKSWASPTPTETSLAAKLAPSEERTGAPISKDKQVRIEPAFGDAIAVWTPAPNSESTLKQTPKSIDVAALAGKPDEKNGLFAEKGSGLSELPGDGWSVSPQPSTLLPEIRPANLRSDGLLAAPNRAFPDAASRPISIGDEGRMHSNPTMKPLASSEQSVRERGGEATTNGVQFAIAHNLSSVPEPRRFDAHTPSLLPDSGTISEFSGAMAATALDRQRPLLLAPPVPGPSMLEATGSSGSGLATSVAAMGSTGEGVSSGRQQSSGRIIWIVVGLLGSGAAVVLGLKYARRDPDAQYDEPVSMSAPNQLVERPQAESDEENSTTEGNMSLKIKRAA